MTLARVAAAVALTGAAAASPGPGVDGAGLRKQGPTAIAAFQRGDVTASQIHALVRDACLRQGFHASDLLAAIDVPVRVPALDLSMRRHAHPWRSRSA